MSKYPIGPGASGVETSHYVWSQSFSHYAGSQWPQNVPLYSGCPIVPRASNVVEMSHCVGSYWCSIMQEPTVGSLCWEQEVVPLYQEPTVLPLYWVVAISKCSPVLGASGETLVVWMLEDLWLDPCELGDMRVWSWVDVWSDDACIKPTLRMEPHFDWAWLRWDSKYRYLLW